MTVDTTLVGDLATAYRVQDGSKFRLSSYDPSDTHGQKSKEEAIQIQHRLVRRSSELQRKLYAQNSQAVLLIFQGMDASGKDGAIRSVMSGLDPQGCTVAPFKEPTSEELSHDYLWRASKALPAGGQIGVFNRSHWEEVLIARVHPEILAAQRLPPDCVSNKIWDQRFEDLNAWERYLSRNGIVIRKFFLHISKDEQRKRFLKRLEHPEKNWKFSASDVKDRAHWDEYTRAYEEMVQKSSFPYAPWYVIPADAKWFARLVIASVLNETLESMHLEYPVLTGEKLKDVEAARKLLLNPS